VSALKPMLLTDGKGYDFPSGGEWRQEPKLDGWRFLFHVEASGVSSYSGRNGSDRTGQPGLAQIEAILAKLPNDTILDAELIVPGEKSPKVSSHLSKGGPLEAVVFDVLRAAGQDTTGEPLHERRRLLERIADLFQHPVRLMPQLDEASEELHQRWLDAGTEGSVVKLANAPYLLDTRTKSQIKFKPQITDEAIVVGFKPGKGGWANRAGAFKIKMLDSGVETTCSTATDLIREEINDDPDKYLNRIIEVAHHGLMDSGKPRHPTFVRLRDDLEKEEPMTRNPIPHPTGRPQPIDDPDCPDSPVRSGTGRIRNVKSMGDEKLAVTVEAMKGYDEADPKGYGAVMAEAASRGLPVPS